MASNEEKAAYIAMASMVTNMITTSVSLKQAQVETSTVEPISLPMPTPVL